LGLDGKGYLFALLAASLLMWRGCPECGIEGDVGLVFACWPRLDVAAALAFGMCARTSSALAASDLV
jgi:hypothetical protein